MINVKGGWWWWLISKPTSFIFFSYLANIVQVNIHKSRVLQRDHTAQELWNSVATELVVVARFGVNMAASKALRCGTTQVVDVFGRKNCYMGYVAGNWLVE